MKFKNYFLLGTICAVFMIAGFFMPTAVNYFQDKKNSDIQYHENAQGQLHFERTDSVIDKLYLIQNRTMQMDIESGMYLDPELLTEKTQDFIAFYNDAGFKLDASFFEDIPDVKVLYFLDEDTEKSSIFWHQAWSEESFVWLDDFTGTIVSAQLYYYPDMDAAENVNITMLDELAERWGNISVRYYGFQECSVYSNGNDNDRADYIIAFKDSEKNNCEVALSLFVIDNQIQVSFNSPD